MAKKLNKNLHQAKKSKNDEFYTQLSDIEKELKHYKKHFKDKVVYCNADDPFESNFFKYFASNFNLLGLKKLIATSYAGSPVVGKQLSLFDIEGVKTEKKKEPIKIEINEVKDFNNDGAVNILDVEYLLKYDKNSATKLKENGDFRSQECLEILEEVDIVVTNPPFSLFREFLQLLVSHKKNFLIIGSQNAVTYKDVFSLIKENKVWLGYNSGDMHFKVPEYYEERATRFWIDETGQKWRSLGNICWFTNLDISKRHEDLILYKTYSPDECPEYDNYNAINVNKVADIPIDYKGAMGVPITFLNKYNPNQYEIISANDIRKNENVPYKEHGLIKDKDGTINGNPTYVRIVIKNKRA